MWDSVSTCATSGGATTALVGEFSSHRSSTQHFPEASRPSNALAGAFYLELQLTFSQFAETNAGISPWFLTCASVREQPLLAMYLDKASIQTCAEFWPCSFSLASYAVEANRELYRMYRNILDVLFQTLKCRSLDL